MKKNEIIVARQFDAKLKVQELKAQGMCASYTRRTATSKNLSDAWVVTYYKPIKKTKEIAVTFKVTFESFDGKKKSPTKKDVISLLKEMTPMSTMSFGSNSDDGKLTIELKK